LATETQLEVTGLCVRRGALRVVRDASLRVGKGEIVGLLGLNGAGKSSLLAAIAGDLPAESGSVSIEGNDVSSRPAWERCASGLVLVPAGRQLFSSLSVVDNLLAGGHLRSKRERAADLEVVYEFFPVLREKAHLDARSLSGGQQQMLAIGRGLMASPRALMLDEPSEGLAPIVVEQVFAAVRRLREEQQVAILLAEQNAGVVDILDTLIVMQGGALGAPRPARQADKRNVAAYMFGTETVQ
jgi:branched-chain amino acid transport system ATP-binding protein